MSKFFFKTDKDTLMISLYTRDREQESQKLLEFEEKNASKRLKKKIPRSVKIQYKQCVYYPTVFETMNQNSIKKYRRSFTGKYLTWALTNKSLILDKNHSDALTTFSSIKDVAYGFMMITTSCFFFNSFMKKLDPPIFDFFLFSDKKFQPRHLRFICLGATFFGLNYGIVNGVLKNNDLFDIGLKYKEYFLEGEIVSPNCEEQFRLAAGLDGQDLAQEQ